MNDEKEIYTPKETKPSKEAFSVFSWFKNIWKIHPYWCVFVLCFVGLAVIQLSKIKKPSQNLIPTPAPIESSVVTPKEDVVSHNLLNQIEILKGQLHEIENSLAKINERVSYTNTLLSKTALSTETISMPKKKEDVHAKTTLYIAAMLPGRAWLTDLNHTQILSVNVGAHVEGYGVVTSLSNDVVLFASGEKIEFSHKI